MMNPTNPNKNGGAQLFHQHLRSESTSSDTHEMLKLKGMTSVSLQPPAYPSESESSKLAGARSSTLLTWSHTRTLLYRGWFWECVCCHIALAVLAVILVLLHSYNGRTLAAQPQIITINTLIAVLVTVMKGLLAVPLAEGMSQLKWSWFKKENLLRDMETFDQASRGAFGASRLLVQHPWHLVSMGAILIFAALAVGPFSQQVIQTKYRTVSSSNKASIPVCSTDLFSDYGEGAGPGMNEVTLPTMGAIYSGIFQTNPERQVFTACDSGNCTFSTYHSLGFCSQCADISSKVTKSCSNETGCTYQLPGGLFLGTEFGTTINATTSNDLLSLGQIPSFLNFTALMGPGDYQPGDAVAVECALWMCVHTYEGSVTGGQFSETSKSTTSTPSSFNPLLLQSDELLYLTPSSCNSNSMSYSSPHNPTQACNYSIDSFTLLSLHNSLNPLLTGSGSRQVANRPSWSQPTMEALYGSSGDLASISSSMSSIASSLTTHARSGVCNGTVLGTSWVNEVYVHVRWNWMMLPVAVVGLTVGFFVITVIRTWDQPVWKSSPLALLFYGLEEGLRERANEGLEMRVRLEESEGSWKLVER